MQANYKRMLKIMQEKEAGAFKRRKKRQARPTKAEKPWLLYILRCADKSFYTGITNDMSRRFKMHMSGRASHYTRTRLPVEIIYQEPCGTRTEAMVRECAVKSYSKKKKETLIAAVTCGKH